LTIARAAYPIRPIFDREPDMTVAFGLIILGGLIYYFAIFRKTRAWNADPRQQQIARMLISAAEGHEVGNESEIIIFMCAQGWQKSELKSRIVHAASITRVSSVPSTYVAVKQTALKIHSAFDDAI
jgi:hypothetical protein